MDNYHLRFPIGEYTPNPQASEQEIEEWKGTIKAFPKTIKETVEQLTEEQLGWRYRPEGWNVAQVVHHCADSHMNAFIRFKLTLTEDNPTIRPYLEAEWSKHSDARQSDLSPSLGILQGVHQRWSQLLSEMTRSDFERTYQHPEYGKEFNLVEALQNYDWHCRHHLAHIKQGLESKGQYN